MTLLSRTQKSKTPSARPSSLSPKPHAKTSNTPQPSSLSPKPPRPAARLPKSRARS